jgi:transposase-like protein
MGAEADAVGGAGYGERSAERTNSGNGYRSRDFDTRVGMIASRIPKLRAGSYFPDWLLERRRRAESALVTVVAMSYLLGVSTRRMEKLVEQLGITRLSKSQVIEMAKDLDEQVESFRTRPLDAGRAGRLRCAPRADRRGRRDPARGDLATVSHPLRGEPDVDHPEVGVGLGQGAAALDP